MNADHPKRRRGIAGRLFGSLLGLAVVAGLVLAGIWWGGRNNNDEANADETVIVFAPAEVRDLRDVVTVRGEVTQPERFDLPAPRGGRVTALSVADGSSVVPGTVIIEIDGRATVAALGDTPYWRSLDARSDDGPDIETLETWLVDEGYDPGTVNEDFSSQTERAIEDWQEDRETPIDGVMALGDLEVQVWPAEVGEVFVEVGDFVSPGEPLMAFVSQEIEIQLTLDPSQRTQLRGGLPVEIEVPATGETATGRIIELDDAATAQGQGADVYFGSVRLDGQLEAVVGTNLTVDVVLADAPGALVVPVAAVLQDGLGDTEIRIVSDDGTIERVRVVTGLTEGAFVEIVSGLEGDEQVVVDLSGAPEEDDSEDQERPADDTPEPEVDVSEVNESEAEDPDPEPDE